MKNIPIIRRTFLSEGVYLQEVVGSVPASRPGANVPVKIGGTRPGATPPARVGSSRPGASPGLHPGSPRPGASVVVPEVYTEAETEVPEEESGFPYVKYAIGGTVVVLTGVALYKFLKRSH